MRGGGGVPGHRAWAWAIEVGGVGRMRGQERARGGEAGRGGREGGRTQSPRVWRICACKEGDA